MQVLSLIEALEEHANGLPVVVVLNRQDGTRTLREEFTVAAFDYVADNELRSVVALDVIDS